MKAVSASTQAPQAAPSRPEPPKRADGAESALSGRKSAPERPETVEIDLAGGHRATFEAAVALDEALIALQGRYEDGMCAIEAVITDASLPRQA